MEEQKIVCPNGCPVSPDAKDGDKCLCGAKLEKTCPKCDRGYSSCEC